MENKNIKRINTIGKVSKIILIIAEVIIIIGMIGLVIGGIAATQIPEGFLTVNGNAAAEVVIDTEKAPFIDIESELDGLESLSEINELFNGFSFDVASKEASDGIVAIDATAEAENFDLHEHTWMLSLGAFVGALVLVFELVIAIFGCKLANAFSKCNSPFEENVIKRMKRFGYSLIPWAVMECIASESVSLTAVLFAAVVILFIQIFSYGAKLQQENDDTV